MADSPPFEVSGAPEASSFTNISLKDLVASQEMGRKQLEEMLRFLKVKIEFEDRLALELNRAVKIPLDEITPPRTTSLNLALWHLRSYTDQRKTDQTLFAIAFEKQVRHPLERAESSMRSDIVQLKIEASRAIKAATQAEMRLRRARITLASFPSSVVEKHRARVESDSSFIKRSSIDKYAAARATATAAKKEAMSCIEARDKTMEEAAAATRVLEKNRAKQMKLALERFVNLERQNLAARSASLDQLQQAVKAVDTEADISRVVQFLKEQQVTLADIPQPSPRYSTPVPSSTGAIETPTSLLSQTVSYSKALALLDWDWKRQLKAAQIAEEVEMSSETSDTVNQHSTDSMGKSDAGERVAESLVGSPLDSGSWAGGILPSVPRDETHDDNISIPSSEQETPIEAIEAMIKSQPTEVLIRDLLFGDRSNAQGMDAYPTSAYASVASEVVDRCVNEVGRSHVLQILNECRTGEVAVPNAEGRFEAVVSIFTGCLGICDEQRDVKHAKQFMIMSETIYCESHTPPLYVQSRVSDHDLWSRRWFWEDVLLIGVTEQFDLSPQSAPWEDLAPEQLHDEVLRVHNTVFAQLGAIVSNMVRFGRSSVDIRKFLAKMCARSQLNEDMCLQLNKMLEAALNSPNRRASALPVLPDSSQLLSFEHPVDGDGNGPNTTRKPTLEGMDDDDTASEVSEVSEVSDEALSPGQSKSSKSSVVSPAGRGRRRSGGGDFLGILARKATAQSVSEEWVQGEEGGSEGRSMTEEGGKEEDVRNIEGDVAGHKDDAE